MHHLRTHARRHEVDLLVAHDARRVIAIEVKLSAQVDDDDVQHLYWLKEQIGYDLAEFKRDAVRLMQERRTAGVPRAYR